MGKPSLSVILLVGLWVLAAAGAAGRYFLEWQAGEVLIGVSSLLFGAGLIWVLGRKKPAINELPEPGVFTGTRPGFWFRTLLLFLGLALTVLLGVFLSPGLSMMVVCGLLGLVVTLVWRKTLSWKIAGVSLAMGLISALGAAFLGSGELEWAVAYSLTIPPAFSGGALLLQRSQLGHVRTLEGKPGLVLKGFLMGCALGLPATFFNLLGDIQSQDAFIVHWWQPLYAIVPAIAEETWARLFLVTFCYSVLRPATHLRPRRAIVIAILISVLSFTLAHGNFNPAVFIIDGLLFSTPYALLLIKKDFEHAVGYHFISDFLRYIAAFLS